MGCNLVLLAAAAADAAVGDDPLRMLVDALRMLSVPASTTSTAHDSCERSCWVLLPSVTVCSCKSSNTANRRMHERTVHAQRVLFLSQLPLSVVISTL
jgi:hypothetical protein